MRFPRPKRLPENWYRDLWLFVVSVFLVLGLKAQNAQNAEIQSGRQATTGITCAAAAAVIKGGQLVITASSASPLPPRLEALLRRYGYPSKTAREVQAKSTAEGYTRFISREIVAVAGVKASRVLEPERLPNGKPNPAAGSLNCKRLRAIARIR